MKRLFVLLVLLIMTIFYVSCEKDDSTGPVVNNTIPPDPGTSPPAEKTGPLKPAVGVKVAEGTTDRIQLNVGGLYHNGAPITYTTSNLTIVEDGVVKGILITPLTSKAVSLETNIVFIIDVTGSMGGTIDGVKESITEFLNNLKTRGLNVKCGAVAYSDNNDTRIPASINGIVSNTDPGAFVVVEYHNLTSNLDSTGTLYQFIDGLEASYKGYGGGDTPEGGFDALYYAYQNFSWSPGAQKIFIVLTDAPSWGLFAPSGSGTTRSPWMTSTLADTLAGNATIHVVSPTPDYIQYDLYDGSYDMHYLATPGTFNQAGANYSSNGTGGVWINLYGTDYSGKVDLTQLPIEAIVGSSVLVEYITTTPVTGEHTIRVVVDIGTDNGEVTIKSNY
ncbi:MAG: VWA domain-containing protein [Ignavibacteriales bacterium]|nr:VWA domain-containing protein [Ignavibacteriales bacterium]